MTITNFANKKPVSNIATRKSSPTTTNFARGIFTYKPNDTMEYDELFLAQNARFDRIGEYKTRHGLEKLSEPVGKITLSDNYSQFYTLVNASQIVATINSGDQPIYSLNLTLATTNDTNYGVCEISLIDTDGNIVATSCVQSLTTAPQDIEIVFKNAPSGLFLVRIAAQRGGKQVFRAATVSGELMYKLNTATPGKVLNIFEANIDSEKTVIFAFQTNTGTTTLYRVENGLPSAMRQLPAGVKAVRFSQNVNQIRYVDGVEGPRLIDPTIWSDTAIITEDLKTEVDLGIKTSNILAGTQDNMMYFDADTTTQAVWTYPYGFAFAMGAFFSTTTSITEYTPGTTSTQTIAKSTIKPISEVYLVPDMKIGDYIMDEDGNYGEITAITNTNITTQTISHAATAINSYDAFDRDFRQNFPAIKTGDPLTAMFNLGGVVYFLTRRNKYYMYSQTADVWTQQASSAQHGTFTQESCVCDLNYAYYANDDGIYAFDGSSETSITQNTIQSTYDAIKNKESITLELFNNRLYVFYSDNGTKNNSCLVFNINLKLWEAFDTGLPVSATTARQTASNRFICGSNEFGQLFTYEDQTSPYADLGSPIDFDIETAYLHFGSPGQLHRITTWRPEFSTTEGDYSVKCGYAVDFTDNVKYAYSINLKNHTVINEHYVWDEPQRYGENTAPTKLTTIPKVYGQFRRCQIRYQHHAAYEPVNFKSHTLAIQTQRII